ncbi:MAG: hypothetical protein K2O49_05260 [Muribaculaceae bacterium]|nr:hypothetical protein [Muribaculaceae bacterium]
MLLGISFTACGSDDKDNPEGPDNQGPYLQKMEVNGRDWMTNIQRDNQGRITQYTEEEDIIKYVYTENAIYAFINGEKWMNYELTNNLITKSIYVYHREYGEDVMYTYQYNSEGYLSSFRHDDYIESTTKVIWSNGNIEEFQTIEEENTYSAKMKYTTYPNVLKVMPWWDEDLFDPILQAYGYYGKTPKFLPASGSYKDWTMTCSYSNFTSNGYPQTIVCDNDIWTLQWK